MRAGIRLPSSTDALITPPLGSIRLNDLFLLACAMCLSRFVPVSKRGVRLKRHVLKCAIPCAGLLLLPICLRRARSPGAGQCPGAVEYPALPHADQSGSRALMYNGKVLMVSGSGNDPSNTNLRAAVWDPIAGTITVQTVAWDMFCNGMVVLPDGRPFINGGTMQYDPFLGQTRILRFRSCTNVLSPMSRTWRTAAGIPRSTTLGDGRVMTFSGAERERTPPTQQWRFTPSARDGARSTPPPGRRRFIPACICCPAERSFISGSTSHFHDSSIPLRIPGRRWPRPFTVPTRTYGTSVLLPLTPANNYDPRVMIMGGGSPAIEDHRNH